MQNTLPSFSPAPLLSHHHAQTMLASLGPRRLFVRARAKAMLDAASDHILNCQDGVRLSGAYTPSKQGNNNSLVILLHGWEGCITSSYLLSSAASLYGQGHSVFRLNFRDHGDSHHLNKALFNSTRITEVVEAVRAIQQQFPHKQVCLAGFSLGGNFSLRVASRAEQAGLQLDKAAAICPLISPRDTTDDIENGLWIYHFYFMRRWKKSLAKKLELFTDYDYAEVLHTSKRLSQLNSYFVPNHTPYSKPEEYLDAYAVREETLMAITTDMHILVADDDPIVQTRWFDVLDKPGHINVQVTSGGGHCGFIKDWRFNSFADDWLLRHFAFSG
jgi:predicted alpha/beta-fold hydrolase